VEPHSDPGTLENVGCCITTLTPITLAVQKDSENDVWKMYLNEIEADDKRMIDAWKQDAKGVLVFVSPKLLISVFVSLTSPKTGLFSATVGTFIIEFYKKLDPASDSSSNTALADQPSHPSASMIWVNAMWLVSLVLSLTSALVATLLQQWARRYIETPNVPNEPNDRARVRMFLFLGTKKYKMPLAVEIAPILLHLSVCLFFGGLVIIFHTINTKVAIAVDVAVGTFGLPYTVITILPFLDIRCPYRTPISFILWYPLHAFLSFVARGLHWLLEQIDECLDSLDSPARCCSTLRRQRIPHWIPSLDEAAQRHWQYFMGSFEKSIIQSAKNPLEDGDRKIITSLFSQLALYDKSKLRELVANIPRNRIRDLIPFTEFKVVLREPLLALLRTCAPDTPATEPDRDVRKRSLLVCLDVIYHIAKSPDVPELNFMRANFANIGLMRTLWNDSDTTIRVISRSICALLAKQVVSQVLEAPQTVWLEAVTGENRNRMYNSDVPTRVRMILKSFVYEVLSNQDGDLPTESFKETLAILLDVRTDVFDMAAFNTRLEEAVEWIQQHDPQSSVVVDKLRTIFPAQ
jgi:hypothetical protein